MNTDWKTFLTDSGAEFGPEPVCEVVSFGNPEREKRVTLTGNVICDLSHLGLITVSGEDAETFLQGQTTNDVREITETTSSLGAYCSPKGRILASFRMFQRDDQYYLRIPAELAEATIKRLSMFVLMSKVSISDASNELVRFGVAGKDVSRELASALGEVPEEDDQTLTTHGLTVVRLSSSPLRYEVYGSTEDCRKLWDRLNVHAAPVGSSSWHLLEIHAGKPQVVEATSDAFVPQMVNLEAIGGVSFQKGCYTGQEIVARMHYLGKVKRRMFRVHTLSAEKPVPGDSLYSAADSTGQPIGTIVNSAPCPDGGWDALAVIVVKYVEEQAPLALDSAKGAELTLQSLPYELPEPKAS